MDIDKVISQAHLNATDWNMEDYYDGISHFKCLSCYIFDFDRKRLEMITIEEERFYKILSETDFMAEEVSHEVIKGVESFMKGNRKRSNMARLATAITAYIGGTMAWQKTKSLVSNGSSRKPNIFIIIYKSKRSIRKALVRPFVVVDERRILPSGEVIDMIKEVVKTDGINHPNWLR